MMGAPLWGAPSTLLSRMTSAPLQGAPLTLTLGMMGAPTRGMPSTLVPMITLIIQQHPVPCPQLGDGRHQTKGNESKKLNAFKLIVTKVLSNAEIIR